MIIGITGLYGAGKGAAVDYLVDERDFRHFSAREFITKEIEKRNLAINRDTMIEVANELRAEHGPVYIIEALFNRAKEYGGDAIVESLRAVAEVEYVQENGGIVIGIDADPRLRYERMTKRGLETDHVTFEEWQQQQEKETNPNDPAKQNIVEAFRHADYIVRNDSSFEELHRQIDEVLAKEAP